MEKHCWFKEWFNSPYYHLLYNKRDESEADLFIERLCASIALPSGAAVWDLACGKGRHAIAFAKRGYKVTGTDLSEKSIREALTQTDSKGAEFYIHDMRQPFRVNYFDLVVNLFTSLGYFENANDNLLVFKNARKALKPGGLFVVDFFNSEKVKNSMVPSETVTRGEVTFHINREIVNGVIHKKINFVHQDNQCSFVETVSLLTKDDFERLATTAKFTNVGIYGDYNLRPFDLKTSNRLILIYKKQA